MGNVNMTGKERGIAWAEHYDKLASKHEYDLKRDRVEIHRCMAAWSVFPRDKPESLLDAGCGDAAFCAWIGGRSARLKRIVGLDVSANRISRARKRYPGMEFVCGDVAKLPFHDNEFDVVTCIEVLEHHEDPLAVVRELLRVASGRVVITVPDRQPVRDVLCPHCNRSFPLYGHIHSFDAGKMADLVHEAGGIVEMCKLHYAARGLSYGLPLWLGTLAARCLQLIHPGPATFMAVRIKKAALGREACSE